MSTAFELVLHSLHRETQRTDGACVPVNYRHDGTDWLVWLGTGLPDSSRSWRAIGGENAMRDAWAAAVEETAAGWWRQC